MKKVCSKCKIEKELIEFSKDKTKKDGVKSNCKSCEKEYRETKRGKRKEYYKTYYQANKDKKKEYYETNKEKIKERQKTYSKTVAGKAVKRRENHKRRTRKKESERLGIYTYQELDECRIFFNDCCAYTGKPLNGGGDVEHLIPISKGGTNNINNIVLALPCVNNSKRANLIDEWYPKQPFYSKKRHNKIKEWVRIKSQINLFEL